MRVCAAIANGRSYSRFQARRAAFIADTMTSAGFTLRTLAYTYSAFVSRHAGLIGGFDNYQIALTVFLLAVFCAVAWRCQSSPRLANRVCPPWVYCLALILALLCVRLPTLLPGMMNPDEGEFVAAAMKLRQDPVFWRSFDSTTSGPLNFFAPALLNLFGLPFDFASARLLNVLCIGGTLALVYLSARHFMEDWCARLTPLPLLGAAMGFRQNDFLHFSSECVPVLLIATGTWLLISNEFAGRASRSRYMALGIIVAILPLAKLQSVPVAAILGGAALASIFMTHRERKWHLAGYLAVGVCLVPALLFPYLAIFGVYDTFHQSFIVNNLLYAGNSKYANALNAEPYTLRRFVAFCFGATDLFWYEIGVLSYSLLALYKLLPRFLHRAMRRPTGRSTFLTVFIVSMLAASAWAVYRPMREFPHYLVFLIFPLCLVPTGIFAALLAERTKSTSSPARIWTHPALIFVLLAVVLPVGLRSTELNSDFESETWMLTASPDADCAACAMLRQLTKPGDAVAIWGWAAEYYVLTGTVPATRESECAREIEKGPQQSYYDHRFLDDMRQSRPGVFVDAVGPGQFRYEDRATAGHEIFPELRDYVRDNYQLTVDIDGARIYRRDDLAER